jgi:hypothetical protein
VEVGDRVGLSFPRPRALGLAPVVSTHEDDTELEFFEEPQTLESPDRPRRRIRPGGGGGPRRPAPPPQGAVALARLAGLVALAIAVVVGLVFWVGSCQGKSKHDEYASYMANIRTIAQDSARTGDAFANALGSPNLSLTSLQAKLDLWSREQQEAYNEALRLRPPASLQSAHQEVLAALQLRAIGLAALSSSVAQAGSKSSADVATDLAKQAQLLTASDLVWTDLFHVPATETLRSVGVTGVIAPPSVFVANPEVISATSFGTVYDRLKSTTSGGKVTGLHGSALVKTEAVTGGGTVKQLSTSTPNTVDVSANLVFRVTFADSGNFQEVKIPVTLSVNVAGKVVTKKTQTVPSILSQHQQTVSFGNLNLPPSSFGANAHVHVEIGKVPGEKRLDNNSATYPVFFSLSTGG